MYRNFSFSIFFQYILKKRKAFQTLEIKGFEALFSWFKLILSEPFDVPGGHTEILIYQALVYSLYTICLPKK